MNHIKLLLLLVISLIFLLGCKDEITINTREESKDGQMVYGRSSDIYTLPAVLHRNWKLKVEGDWMLPLAMSGNETTPLQIYLEENSLLGDRSGKVEVTTDEGETLVFDILQQGRNNDTRNIHIPGSYEKTMGTGWGYDSNSYLADSKGVKDQILNPFKISLLNQLPEYKGEVFIQDEYTSESNSFYSCGSSSVELSQSLAVEAGLELGIPYAFSLDIQARFSKSDLQSTSNKFAIFRYKYIMKRRVMNKANIMALVNDGKDIFSSGFKHYLELLRMSDSPALLKEFVDLFGNSVVLSADIGGRMDYNMTAYKTEKISKESVGISAKVGLLSLFSIAVSREESEMYRSVKENCKFSLSACGGDVSILGKAVVYNDVCGEEVMEAWGQSINESNSELMDCILIPIWELIPDRTVRARVQSYVTGKRIEEDQLILPEPSTIAMKAEIPAFNECPTLIKVAWAAGSPCIEFCEEYLPKISILNRVVIAYPIVNNCTDYQNGVFPGDGQGHKPGKITWLNGDYTYEEFSEFSPTDVVAKLYKQGDGLSLAASTGVTYAEAIIKDYYASCHGESYPLVRCKGQVFFRSDLHTSLFRKGDSAKKTYVDCNGIYYYLAGFEDEIDELPPLNWRVPNTAELSDIRENLRTTLVLGELSGLDLTSGAITSATKVNEVYTNAYLNKNLLFLKASDGLVNMSLNPPSEVPIAAPLRPIRSESFRYQ